MNWFQFPSSLSFQASRPDKVRSQPTQDWPCSEGIESHVEWQKEHSPFCWVFWGDLLREVVFDQGLIVPCLDGITVGFMFQGTGRRVGPLTELGGGEFWGALNTIQSNQMTRTRRFPQMLCEILVQSLLAHLQSWEAHDKARKKASRTPSRRLKHF